MERKAGRVGQDHTVCVADSWSHKRSADCGYILVAAEATDGKITCSTMTVRVEKAARSGDHC
jgi:hypothetical protein